MEWIIWVIVGLAALCALIYVGITLYKATPEKRKELLINWLKAVVHIAEDTFVESGKGAEKMQMAKDWFNNYAPKLYKLIIKIDKLNIEELIESALTYMKEHNWYK